MENRVPALFLDLMNRSIAFVPRLLAGVALLFLGILVAWFVKRLVIQVSIALRLERFLTKFRWGKAFSKADVRYGFYNFIGNLFYFFILLAFLDLAFLAWDLKVLSDLLGNAISLFPRIAAAAIIMGFGWFIAVKAASGILTLLLRDNLPQARFIALYARIMLIVFFSAMALVILNVAGNIVLIGFAVVFVALGIIAVALAVMQGKDSFRQGNGLEGRTETENSED